MRNYDEIANRVLERRDEHIKSKRKKIKILTGVCCAVLAVFAGLGLWKNYFSGSQPFGIHGEETTVEPTLTPADPNNPIASGGDEYDWFNAYSDKVYGVSSELITYIEDTLNMDWRAWRDSSTAMLRASKYGASDPEYIPLLVSAIKKYDIPRSVIEQINSEHIAGYIEMEQSEDFIKRNTFSSEEIDALYSGDLKEISRVFPAENAIIHNGRAFAPKWYLNATDEELAHYGISKETVRERAFYFASRQGSYIQYKTAEAYFKAAMIEEIIYGEKPYYPPEEYDEAEWNDTQAAEYFGRDFSALQLNSAYQLVYTDNGAHKVILAKNGEIASDWYSFVYNGAAGSGKQVVVSVSKISPPSDCEYVTENAVQPSSKLFGGTEIKLYLMPGYSGYSWYEMCVADFELDGIYYRVEGKFTELESFYNVLETIINES